jgi:hypothetical protein
LSKNIRERVVICNISNLDNLSFLNDRINQFSFLLNIEISRDIFKSEQITPQICISPDLNTVKWNNILNRSWEDLRDVQFYQKLSVRGCSAGNILAIYRYVLIILKIFNLAYIRWNIEPGEIKLELARSWDGIGGVKDCLAWHIQSSYGIIWTLEI